MNNVHLMGAEAVERAGVAMERAAEKMAQAVKDLDFTLMNHQRFLNDWLLRLQGELEDVMPDFNEPIDVRVVKDETEVTPAMVLPTIEHDWQRTTD